MTPQTRAWLAKRLGEPGARDCPVDQRGNSGARLCVAPFLLNDSISDEG